MGWNSFLYKDREKVEKTKLKGCQSTVYFYFKKYKDERIHFKACSDAAIVQGLIALLLRVYNNRSSLEILNTSTNFITKIGLDDHLSVTRKNGLSSMINAIKQAVIEKWMHKTIAKTYIKLSATLSECELANKWNK